MLKKVFLLQIPFILLCLRAGAQLADFAPIGATWWYDQIQKYPPYDISYWRLEAKSDTVIGDLDLRVIQTDFITETSDFTDTFYLHIDSGVISIYDPSLEILAPYFDFNAVPGDTLIVSEGLDMAGATGIVIDSIHIISIAGQDLREFYFHNTFESVYYLGGWTFTERIGNSGFFFPQHGAADPPTGGPLRCYEDDVIGLYGATDISECDFISDVKTETAGAISIYPNPSDDIIFVSGVPNDRMRLELSDISGRHYAILSSTINADVFSLNISKLSSGIYFLKIVSGDNETNYIRFIRK